MLELRLTRLPDETQYFLDAACEHYELSSVAQNACTLFGDPAVLAELMAARKNLKPFSQNARRVTCLAIERYGVELVNQLRPTLRAAFALWGCKCLLHFCDELIDVLPDWLYADSTEGGALNPFLPRVRCDRDYFPTKKLARRLMSAEHIRRYVKRADEPAHLRDVFTIIAGIRVEKVPPDELFEGLDYLERAHQRQLEAYRREEMRRYDLMWHGPHGSPQRKVKAAIRRKHLKAIRKAAAFASNLIGQAAVSAFDRGERVEVAGVLITFIVQKTGYLAMEGHGALAISVRDNHDGANLGRLCVYQPKTPALDQLATIALFTAAGDELEYLESGNLSGVNAWNAPRADLREEGPYEKRRRRVREYTAATLPIWKRAIRETVFGPALKTCEKFADG